MPGGGQEGAAAVASRVVTVWQPVAGAEDAVPEGLVRVVFGPEPAACAGVAGGLISTTQAISPNAGDPYTLQAFVVVVLGGLGRVGATVVGGLLFGLIETLGQTMVPGLGAGYPAATADASSPSVSTPATMLSASCWEYPFSSSHHANARSGRAISSRVAAFAMLVIDLNS